MTGFRDKTCPKCGSGILKNWRELSVEEKLLAERLPLSAEFSRIERKRHLFCPKCWFENTDEPEKYV